MPSKRSRFIGNKIYMYDDYQYIHGIIGIIGLIAIIILIVTHTFRFINNYITFKRQNKITKVNKSGMDFPDKTSGNYYYVWVIHLLVFCAFFAGLTQSIVGVITYMHLNLFNIIQNNCHLLLSIIVGCTLYVKHSMYFIGMFRVFSAYNGTSWEYSTSVKYILIIYFISMALFEISTTHFFGEGITIYNSDKNYYWCQYTYNIWYGIVSSAMNFTINIMLLTMFIKPLIQIVNHQTDTDSAIISLIVQYTILVAFGIISTFAFYIMYILGFGSAQIFDITINACCVLLTGTLYTKYYTKLCGLCHNKLQTKYLERMNQQTPTLTDNI